MEKQKEFSRTKNDNVEKFFVPSWYLLSVIETAITDIYVAIISIYVYSKYVYLYFSFNLWSIKIHTITNLSIYLYNLSYVYVLVHFYIRDWFWKMFVA